jgi:hypothetical protein
MYFEGSSPQQKNPGALAGGAPLILHVPTFPWKYFFSTKRQRSKEIKREYGEVLILVCSHEVQKHPWAGTSPYNLMTFST